VALQRSAGNQAVVRWLSRSLPPGVQRQGATAQTDLQRLDEMLDRFNVPESDVIRLIRGMSVPDKQAVATNTYRGRIASALNFGEMMQVVTALPLTLAEKLEWLDAAATMTSGID
jgi:hypothetical protein